jgi:molybdopterin-synthase adenylyltransferase
LAYGKELFDLATDTHKDENNFYFGGRLAYVAPDEPNCLVCMDMIDLKAAQEDLASEKSRQDRDSIYGVDRSELNEIGPSVVSLNGVIASLAVQEYMVQTTGIRKAARQLQYRGNMGIVAVSRPQECSDCYFCNVVKDSLNDANLERYL